MNVHDYLLWRGDIPLTKERPLNEVDSLVLSRFSYLPFNKINITEKEKERIESLCKRLTSLDDNEFLYNGDKELATYLSNSLRFKDMLVTDYIKIDDKTFEKQFGAVTIHLSDSKMYISYIGTNKTINGWKEDFNMTFMDNVPCQISGLEYLVKMSKKYPNKKIVLGGHSKGGNIAIYAALTSPKEVQDRIIKVDNFDGPGLNKTIINKYQSAKITSKIETYIPQESVIGRLLEHREKITICESKARGILQHDVYSWCVLKDELVKQEKNTKISEYINNTATEWLKETTKEQRKIFIDTIFEIFNSAEVESFGEIKKYLKITIPKILKKYKGLSDEEKKIMTEMLKRFVTAYFNVLKKKITR